MSKYPDEDYLRYARSLLYTDELEIDENAEVSAGDDDGAFVQAWVWIDDDDVERWLQTSGKD